MAGSEKKVEARNPAFGRWLVDRQAALGLTNAALGRKAGVSGQMVGKYRAGAVPGSDKAGPLAAALGVSKEELMRAVEGAPPETDDVITPPPYELEEWEVWAAKHGPIVLVVKSPGGEPIYGFAANGDLVALGRPLETTVAVNDAGGRSGAGAPPTRRRAA